MSNADQFKRPGEYMADFIISLFNATPQHIDPLLYNLMVVILALFFWVQVVKIVITLIRRLTGFEHRRY